MAARRPRSRVLAAGDVVGVVAPGFAVRRQALARGVAYLAARGFDVRVGPHVLSRDGYLAGTDDERAADLAALLLDPRVRAIWFARGGYGTARLLERVPWDAVAGSPKLLVGYSDATALFVPAVERAGCVCLYGPVVSELGRPAAWHAPSLLRLLAGRPWEQRLGRRHVLVPGRARGRLVGGNLSVLSHLCGTPYQPDTRGTILFLEDVGEATYRVDRMLTQLAQAGLFRQLAGVVLGHLAAPARRRFPPDRQLGEVVREAFAGLGVPVVQRIPAGHLPAKRTLPLGATAEIDTPRGVLRLGS